MSADLTRLIVEALAYLITSGLLAQGARLALRYADAHLSARQAALLDVLAQRAVAATEQLAGGKLDNKAKRLDAAKRLAALAQAHNLPLTPDEIETLIEAAVNALPPTAPPPAGPDPQTAGKPVAKGGAS